MEDLIYNIEKLNPQAEEYIVLKFNTSMPCKSEQLKHIFKTLQKMFPSNLFIAIPDWCVLETLSRKQLLEVISKLTSIVENTEE